MFGLLRRITTNTLNNIQTVIISMKTNQTGTYLVAEYLNPDQKNLPTRYKVKR